jgi:hypothetical protein
MYFAAVFFVKRSDSMWQIVFGETFVPVTRWILDYFVNSLMFLNLEASVGR